MVKALDSASRGCQFESQFRRNSSSPSPQFQVVGSESSPLNEIKKKASSMCPGHVRVKEPMATKKHDLGKKKSVGISPKLRIYSA